MRKFLKIIGVIQHKQVAKKFGDNGKLIRINPYNPISYLAIIIICLIGLILFGIKGFRDEVDTRNIFRWRNI
jgi:hypothetical protein